MSDPVAGGVAAALRVVFAWFVDCLADALARKLADREAVRVTPEWGMVSQKTLPSWIHPDVYVEACRSGRIAGARLWRRQWLSPREAVEAWWNSEARAPGQEKATLPADPEDLDSILTSNGLEPRSAR